MRLYEKRAFGGPAMPVSRYESDYDSRPANSAYLNKSKYLITQLSGTSKLRSKWETEVRCILESLIFWENDSKYLNSRKWFQQRTFQQIIINWCVYFFSHQRENTPLLPAPPKSLKNLNHLSEKKLNMMFNDIEWMEQIWKHLS